MFAMIHAWLTSMMEKSAERIRTEPCRKHIFDDKPFHNCPDCGWSSNGFIEEKNND